MPSRHTEVLYALKGFTCKSFTKKHSERTTPRNTILWDYYLKNSFTNLSCRPVVANPLLEDLQMVFATLPNRCEATREAGSWERANTGTLGVPEDWKKLAVGDLPSPQV